MEGGPFWNVDPHCELQTMFPTNVTVTAVDAPLVKNPKNGRFFSLNLQPLCILYLQMSAWRLALHHFMALLCVGFSPRISFIIFLF